MDLLISNSEELKTYLGFLDADLNFNNMKSDFITATNKMIKFIGKTTYDAAVTAYKKPSPSDIEKELVFSVAYPIVIDGYRNYAPSADVIHSNNGRSNRIEEHEKPAFEWQIDRDNKSLEKRYYTAMDDMIDFLDTNSTPWKESTNYKTTFDLFIRNTSDFDKYFNINASRLLMIMLAPGIRLAENSDIKSRIGITMFDNMKKKLKGETVADFTLNTSLHEKIKEALVYKSLAWAMPRLSVQLFPEGVLQAYSSDRMTTQAKMIPVKSEAAAAAQRFDYDASTVLIEIENLMAEINQSDVPVVPPDPITFKHCIHDNFINT